MVKKKKDSNIEKNVEKEKKSKKIEKKIPTKENKKRENLFAEISKKKKGVNDDSRFSIYEVIVIILISILFGILIGYIIIYSRDSAQIGHSSNVNEMIRTYDNLLDYYYGEVDPDKLADAAIKGMVDSLEDPNSIYMDQDETDNSSETVDGTIVGIGVVVLYDNEYNTIIRVYDDSPADRAGLKVDDVILKVDGKDVVGVYGDSLTKLIRGKINTNVHLTIRRGDEEKEFVLKRKTIDLESVSNQVIDYEGKKVGYIKLDSIASNTYKQFYSALKRLEKNDIDSLVIDVRDNLGGHLLQTKQILSLFFDRKTILYQIESKSKTQKVYSDSSATRKYPVAVLINENSASAAEIIASCFQENYKKATIIGTTSYGKGTVQKSQDLNSGSSIRYTTQKWLTSKGEWLNERGVTPDVVIGQSEEYYEKPIYTNDAILQEALSQLNK